MADQDDQEAEQSLQPASSSEQLVREVAERVWVLWQTELRLERERHGGPVRR
jgi:hypothetical protein